jgi:hypothetical protein
MRGCAAMTFDARAVRLKLAMPPARSASNLAHFRVSTRRARDPRARRLSRGSLTRTGGPHARTASICSSRSAKSAAATCDAGLWCRVTQAGHTLRLRQPRIQCRPLSAGGALAACAAAKLPPARPARSPPQRSPSVPPHAARRGDLEGEECLPIGLRPRTAGRMDCARTVLAGPYRSSNRTPVAPCSALPGITRTVPPVRSTSMQASSRQASTTELTSRKPQTARCMDRAGCVVPCCQPWNPRGAQIAAAFAARASFPHGAGKQRAAIAGTWRTESRPHACHRSSQCQASHRV